MLQVKQNQLPRRKGYHVAATLLLMGLSIVVSLAVMGRVVWCQAGDLWPWSWNIWSRHNSQHMIDPYSLSHLQHGVGLYLLLTILFGTGITPYARIVMVALVEAVWEIAENTDWMIQRYRATTISLHYYGDSIFNSLGDYLVCLAGVFLARRLAMPTSAALFALLEIVSICWIRDSLLLNALMLLWPIEAVRQWQQSG